MVKRRNIAKRIAWLPRDQACQTVNEKQGREHKKPKHAQHTTKYFIPKKIECNEDHKKDAINVLIHESLPWLSTCEQSLPSSETKTAKMPDVGIDALLNVNFIISPLS